MKTIKIITLLIASLLLSGAAWAQSAGPDQTVCQHLYVNMAATGSSGTWSQVRGPIGGTSVIAQPGSPTTVISRFSLPGVYVYAWDTGMTTDTTHVTVLQNDAGQPQVICQGDTAAMTAAAGTGVWSLISGNPDNSTFFLSNQAATHIEFPGSVNGLYNYLWTNTNGCYDTLRITKANCPDGAAGPDQTVCKGLWATMGAVGTGTWSMASGPAGGTSVIANPNLPGTMISHFTIAGVYYYTWSYTAGIDTVQVTVLPNDAGPDQVVCTTDTAVTTAAQGTGVWSVVSGNPGFSQFFLANQAVTHIEYQGAVAGHYYYIWTNTNGCQDTIIVSKQSCGPPSAGPDRDACLYSSIRAAATGSGTWVISASNPAPAMVASFTDSATDISGFTAVGDYTFVWHTTVNDDTMVVHIHAAPTVAFSNTITTTSAEAIATVTSSASATGANGSNLGYWSDYVYYVNSPTEFGLHVTNSGIYNFIATDAYGCRSYNFDTVNVPSCHLTGSLIGYSSATNDTFVSHIYGATGSLSYAWRANTGFAVDGSVYIANHNTYPSACVTATDSLGCSITICDTLVGSPDMVWPGDADANHLVDNTDLLPIGLGYGSTGPVRIFNSNVWQGDTATNWASVFTNYVYYVNYKHADCDGNGTINADDTVAILQNYGQVHNKTNQPAPWRSGIPALSIHFTRDTVLNGDTLTADILLGDASLQASNIYGLAFTYNFDPTVTDAASAKFSFESSWLGSAGNSISIHKDFPATGVIKAAITGIDHLNRSGYGLIARMRTIITTDNINGKDLSYYQNSAFISDVTAIDEHGNVVAINEGTDSNQVGYTATGIPDLTVIRKVNIYPNPSTGLVEIASAGEISEIMVSDMIGQQVYVQTGLHGSSQSLDLSGVEAGIYLITISNSTSKQTVRLTLTR